jgi:hypothetical protein
MERSDPDPRGSKMFPGEHWFGKSLRCERPRGRKYPLLANDWQYYRPLLIFSPVVGVSWNINELLRFRFQLKTCLAQFRTTKIFLQNLAFYDARSSIVSQKVGLEFFTFVLHFMLDHGLNLVPEPERECITVPVSLRQKVPVPAGVPQYC